jgi:serine/threonine-protein kinase
MVLIPEGPWLSGRSKTPAQLPAFYIDRTEVTNDAFARFCAATQRALPAGLHDAPPDFPVVNVTIDEAREFARWADKRLPTREEWEKAARGPDGRPYPWGTQPDSRHANTGSHGLAPVTAFASGQSPFGVRQMAGNVWEFVDELSSPARKTIRTFQIMSGLQPPPTSGEAWFLIAGGSYRETPQPAYAHLQVPARFRSDRIGFRLVKDVR